MQDLMTTDHILERRDMNDRVLGLLAVQGLGPANVLLKRNVVIRHAVIQQRAVSVRIGADECVAAKSFSGLHNRQCGLGRERRIRNRLRGARVFEQSPIVGY